MFFLRYPSPLPHKPARSLLVPVSPPPLSGKQHDPPLPTKHAPTPPHPLRRPPPTPRGPPPDFRYLRREDEVELQVRSAQRLLDLDDEFRATRPDCPLRFRTYEFQTDNF